MDEQPVETTAELAATVDRLVDRWCERRSFDALRCILAAWPSPLHLTDDWGELRDALRNVLAFARPDLEASDIDTVEKAITAIDIAMNRGRARSDERALWS